MKIYKVERTDGGGYDTYDSFICFANSAEEARYINPDEYYIWKDGGWCFVYADGAMKREKNYSWTEDPKTLKVWELDRSPTDGKPTVILASYNAG